MIINLKKFENGKCVPDDSHEVLGAYAFMGSEYIITKAKPGSGSLVEVMEVVTRPYIRFNDNLTGGDYERNEILKGDFFIGVRRDETPVTKYIKRIYSKYMADFYGNGKILGIDSMFFKEDGILVPSTPRSSDKNYSSLNSEIMRLPEANAIILDYKSFDLSQIDRFLSQEHSPEMQRVLGRYKGKNKK